MIVIELDDDLVSRFWTKVHKSSGCWEWQGKRDRWGYGRINARGNKTIKAHRLSYVIHRSPIPQGLNVLHTCDNPRCVRPDHLWLGTIADNNRDMAQKGRARSGRGKRKPTKMNVESVRELRKLRQDGWTFIRLAGRFGITKSYARKVALGIRLGDIE